MTPKQYLSQYRNAERTINAKLKEISLLRSMLTNTTVQLSSDNIQSSPQDNMSKVIAKIVDMENEVDAEIDELKQIKRQVAKAINALDNAKLRTLLRLRYICGMTFEEIEVEMEYTYKWICILHGRALEKVKEYIEVPKNL